MERLERERREAEERERERLQKVKEIVDQNEMNKLEEWTNKKCSEVIFDSNKDDWSQNTSVFDDRVMNKSNLMFVIEDTNNNKFGGYITATINKCDNSNYIHDSNAFVFSLKSNERLNGMMKFEIKDPECGIKMYEKSHQKLFGIGGGHDIRVCKKSYQNGGGGYQQSFNYEGHQNVLKGSGNYTMKIFVVI